MYIVYFKQDKFFASQVKLEDSANVVGVCPECGNPVIETEKGGTIMSLITIQNEQLTVVVDTVGVFAVRLH